MEINNVIVIGSSKGLGAALVDKFLSLKDASIIGISRTNPDNINELLNSDKYKHIQMDISSGNSVDMLKQALSSFDDKPVCIVYNAAYIKSDIEENGFINFEKLRETNAVGIDGLANVVEATEEYLCKNGGIFIGISSFSALSPAIFFPTASYPASKAYLNMFLRSLRLLWRKKNIKVIAVNLGYMRELQAKFPFNLVVTSYSDVAGKIVKTVKGKRKPEEINYTTAYNLIYRGLGSLPDSICYTVFQVMLKKIANFLKNGN